MAYQVNEKIYDHISGICLAGFDSCAKPLELLHEAWEYPDFPMHCPEHHYLVPAVLLTVYRRLKTDDKALLKKDLMIAEERAKNLLAGFCGWYGACGAAVGSGIFLSLLTGTSPYSTQTWSLANLLTAECLKSIAAIGGPRCCKRVCFASITTTVDFMQENLNLNIGDLPGIQCSYHEYNAECKKGFCPYYGEDGELVSN